MLSYLAVKSIPCDSVLKALVKNLKVSVPTVTSFVNATLLSISIL